MSLSPNQRSRRARRAANARAKRGPIDTTAAREARRNRYLDEVDPNRLLSEAERTRRAEAARRLSTARKSYQAWKSEQGRTSVTVEDPSTVLVDVEGRRESPFCLLVPANTDGPFDPPEWLWEGRIPLGELTIIGGRGEVGKTTITIDLAAQLSRGELPGSLFGLKGKTLFFSDEASFERVITPRYVAARGERGGLYKLDFFDTVGSTGIEVARPMRLETGDIRMLAERIEEEGINLLVFDPIDMLLGGINAHRNNEVRAALRMIMSVGCTVIGIQHVTKGANVAYAGDRVIGSAAFRNFPRSVLVAAYDRSDTSAIVLAHDKSNNGPRQKSLSLEIVESDIPGFARVEWLGEVSTSADDLLVTRNREPSLVQQCRAWLVTLLTTNGPTDANEVKRLAEDEGYGRTTLYEARKLAEASTDRQGRWTL